ncbi:Putative BRCT domain, DNA-directed DNA polymerase X, DNA polymerase beta-like protein [Septoria linicola]|uniref:DNA polymerase lambda n=1 Tax=Septoria linicola TaxID=215465 RepID=A0A9Q9ADC4_9PEZI|nr:putative BRCT domain, DNA-directed DNA polymerase X, DNA polymerase beta-like protein [Septoria linicola]USW47464.1 Putative BRCT domain, DNA-directed DNA polymerase X, DNA polymerase beta-like protein [Septoria linicola]
MSSGGDERLAHKRQMFDALDSLDDSTDEEVPDLGRQASEDALRRAASRRQRNQQAYIADQRQLARSVSDSTFAFQEQHREKQTRPAAVLLPSTEPGSEVAKAHGHLSSTNAGIGRALPAAPLYNGLRHTVSDISALQTAVKPDSAKVVGKRRREVSLRAVPDALRVFQGLQFYFFPNNESAPARRMRIARAREYGAIWHRDWNSQVTHIIFDRNMTFDQLKQWLKLETLPDKVIVVSEAYPAECITYGVLLDPSSSRFAVKGFVPSTVTRADSTESETSLKLKPAKGKAEREAPVETPPGSASIVLTTPIAVSSSFDTSLTDGRAQVSNNFQSPGIDSSRELDEAIAKAKALEQMHIGEDEDEQPGNSKGPGSDNEGSSAAIRLPPKRKGKFHQMHDKWQCMQKNTGQKSNNPNTGIINILQQMADYYGQTGDEWRIRAYRKAISTLHNHPVKITTKEEAGALPNIGPRLAEKIEEIAFTNRLRRLDNAKAEPTDQVLQAFMGVYGAGLKQASEWVKQGYQTLDDLAARAPLTENQRIGIEHYEHFNSRIPRAEVAKHGAMVREALQRLDSTYEVIIGGSYRRGSMDSGDIDCIITRPDTGAAHLRNIILGQLVPQLTTRGFLVANLAMTSKDDGSKWHGASCLPGSNIWRRMDLLLVPSEERGAALIYFTGNDIFNRSLRLLASTKGMRLNQRGLYKDVIRGKNREKLCEGTLVEGKDEKKIFEILGVPWRVPEHRIC